MPGFDRGLRNQRDSLGHGNVYALSLAFYYASAKALGIRADELLSLYRDRRLDKPGKAPRLLFNILNGGSYARTNPVLSDFSEFLLVPREGDLEFHLEKFHVINRRVREDLAGLATSSVNGNPVSQLGANSNRAWIEFILSALDKEKLSGVFGLMIDASAGHLVEDGR